MQFIEIKDYILLPIYLAIIYVIAYNRRNSRYNPHSPLYKYYIPALTAKIVGALSLGIVYQYYYRGGDTGIYFINSKLVSEFFFTDFGSFIDLIFKPVTSTVELRNSIRWLGDNYAFSESNFFAIRILAPLQLLTFGSYLASASIFAYLSFIGVWKVYTSFVHIYPNLYKKFAIAFLFMPSVFFWGSGILKDSVCIAALGWLFYGCYMLFILRIRIAQSVVIVLLSISVLMIVKVYIALAFLPSLLFWIFFTYRSRIRSTFLKVTALPAICVIVLLSAYFVVMSLSKDTDRFAVNQIVNQAATFNTNNMVNAGSAIDIGVTQDMSVQSLIKIAPLAIITTLFRPFIWEGRSALMLLSALEATYVLLIFLSLLKTNILSTFSIILQNPLVTFCLIFSICFAFAVGFSTSNFGTLVRYKIPCVPFFMVALFILQDKTARPLFKVGS